MLFEDNKGLVYAFSILIIIILIYYFIKNKKISEGYNGIEEFQQIMSFLGNPDKTPTSTRALWLNRGCMLKVLLDVNSVWVVYKIPKNLDMHKKYIILSNYGINIKKDGELIIKTDKFYQNILVKYLIDNMIINQADPSTPIELNNMYVKLNNDPATGTKIIKDYIKLCLVGLV